MYPGMNVTMVSKPPTNSINTIRIERINQHGMRVAKRERGAVNACPFAREREGVDARR